MQIAQSECGCELHTEAGQVVRVDTCPVCLPAGAITWLIENGRQLELFPEGRVDAGHERNDPTDRHRITGRAELERLVLHHYQEEHHARSTDDTGRED